MVSQPVPIRILQVENEARLHDVRALLREYWQAFAFDPCFQNFGVEVAQLPGDYAPPSGRLALAIEGAPPKDERVTGCIALRPLSKQRCEMKRLYVRDAFRGRGIGLALVQWLLAQARAIGYQEMYLDTMPSMKNAIAMYERLGFQPCDAYTSAPAKDALCYRLTL